jgi:hypothetical protein
MAAPTLPANTPPYLVKPWHLAQWLIQVANEQKYTPMEVLMAFHIGAQAILGKALEIESAGK